MPRHTLTHRLVGLVMLGLLVLPLFAISGCNTGSRNPSGGELPPPVDPTFPQLEAISPESGRPGDPITLTGKNFSLIPSENHVLFTNFAGTVEIPGKVESVNVGLFLPGDGAPSTMSVRVPTGVRSGFLSLEVDTPANGRVNSGGRGFSAAPVVLGYAINDDGQGLVVKYDAGGNVFPDFITLIGINLINNVTDVAVNDGIAAATAPSVTNGAPFTSTYLIPSGLEAITVELPNGLLPNLCVTSQLTFTANATGFPSGGAANPILIPYAQATGPVNISDVPPYITGISVPAGVRAGVAEIRFNLAAEPSPARWDVVFEYQDPTSPGVIGVFWLPCMEVAGTMTGEALIPGTILQGSSNPAIIGPGTDYSFFWDTIGNFPPGGGTQVTKVRMTITNASPAASATGCPGAFTTDLIVIDNDGPVTGTIVEDFIDSSQESQATTALWNIAPFGSVTGVAGPSAPNYGTGTVDVVLALGQTYEINSDFGSITDTTDPNNPIDLLSPNPGAAFGEFHVRTLDMQEGAILSFTGSKPVVFRVSGTGDDNAVVATIAGEYHFDGESAINATTTDNALGAAGSFAGGGKGGDGARVDINAANQEVTGVTPAQDGEGNGAGGGGPVSTLILTMATSSVPRAGQGGGAGHAEYGEAGVNDFLGSTTSYNSPSGRAGLPFGDSAITTIRGGAGGGGGGATPVKLSLTNFQARQGGGGGGGGGAFGVIARGSVQLTGIITCDGGSGSIGGAGSQAGAGGGGAGGSILVRATGNVALGAEVVLSAKGGFGGLQSPSTTNALRGGNGSPGRIRLEANGQLLSPGINDGTYLPMIDGTSPGVTEGVSTGTIETGTGIDGVLDSSILGASGEFMIDTDLGKIFDAGGLEVFANNTVVAEEKGTFNLTRLDIPAGVTLVGFGSNPLIFRVSGLTDVRGTIDVSGEAGGIPDYLTDPLNPTPGLGGRGGAGGGDGGNGGSATLLDVGLAGAGGMPPTMPPQLISSIPPLGGGGGGGAPTPGSPATPAQPGFSLATDGTCAAGAGGGGGYASDGSGAPPVPGCPIAGDGGTKFGATFFLVSDPLDLNEPIELRVGGGAGAGGGGYTDNIAVAAPGAGGGGAGGYLEIASAGQLKIHSTAVLLAVGGDAFQASFKAGNGGSGAGGAIRIRGESRVEIETGASFDLRGGEANTIPGSELAVGYPANGQLAGGEGSDGRLRVETPLGFSDGAEVLIDPPFTSGPFATAGLGERRAISEPYRVSADGATYTRPAVFGDPVVTMLTPLPADAHVIPLFEGAFRDPENSAEPGPFFGFTDDLSLLDGVEYIRMQLFLYSSDVSTPVIDKVEIPFFTN